VPVSATKGSAMTGSGMEDDIRRKAAQHSRDAYNRVKAIHISLIKTAATRQLGDTLKVARNELDEITFILKNVNSDKHWDMAPRLRAVNARLSELKFDTVSQALSDIRHAIGALQRDVTT
jgi:hypothetical protein